MLEINDLQVHRIGFLVTTKSSDEADISLFDCTPLRTVSVLQGKTVFDGI